MIVFQILDPIEESFAFEKNAVFIDMETDEELTTQPHQIRKAYGDAFTDYLERIKKECLNFGIEYNLINTTQPFDTALLSFIKKRARLL